MYTPKRSYPLSPPTGQSPPTQQIHNGSAQKGTNSVIHSNNPRSGYTTVSENERSFTSAMSNAQNELQSNSEQIQQCEMQEQSKQPRSISSFYSDQPCRQKVDYYNDETTCYKQYYPDSKKGSSSESNMYYAEAQKWPVYRSSLPVNDKNYNELISFCNSKNAKKENSIAINSINNSHSSNNSIKSLDKCQERNEQHYACFSLESNSETKFLKTNDDLSEFKCSDTKTIHNFNCGTKFFSNNNGIANAHNTMNGQSSEENVSCNEFNELYFKQEINYNTHITIQNNQRMCLMQENLSYSFQNPSTSSRVKRKSICIQSKSPESKNEATDLSVNAMAMHQKQYAANQMLDTMKYIKKQNEINEKVKTPKDNASKTYSSKAPKKSFTRDVIFKPYSNDCKDTHSTSANNVYPKFGDVNKKMLSKDVNKCCQQQTAQVDGDSDVGSDGEKASFSTASQCSVPPSPLTSEAVDLRQAVSDNEDQHVPHIFIPGQNNQQRTCLVWACKACKKKSVTPNQRQAATLRERNRLKKLNEAYEVLKRASTLDSENDQKFVSKVDILKNAIEYIESLEDILHVPSSIRERDCDSSGSDYGAVNSPPYFVEHYQDNPGRINLSCSSGTPLTNNVSSLDCLSLIVQNINPETSSLFSSITKNTEEEDFKS
ncbi:hypothetical protein JTE90_025195 [Oedothorax gibbosus]|uniref:BHLH domain-containing protein n=1 Tax=Oedothorax gibbosus TaxID=931172 RepID=A0AAV6UBJ8_9ARAC|nr:hypothetical protein JTE90_025195 [Oedothorax gibbosus]